jgi:puromycin-sensitive aminopeptidase
MRRHGRANAVADDLWNALGEASGQPVTGLANAWIGQGGFPLVEVERRGASLRVSQRRFLSDPDAAPGDARWPVPLVLRWRDDEGVREHRHLLARGEEEIAIPARGAVRWLCANAGATGFYRVRYDAGSLAALAASLGELAPPERIALLADGWALVRARRLDAAAFLDLLAGFGAEEDDAVLDELVGRLAAIEHRLDGAPRAAFQRFVARLLGPSLARAGWDAAPGEADGPRLRRAALVRALGLVAREEGTVREARARLERFLGGDGGALEANLHDAAVAMAARGGDAGRFAELRARYASEKDPAFRRRYLLALAQFEDPALAARARELLFAGEVPLQDAASFAGALLANRAARDPYWAALRERWPEVEAAFGGAPMLLRRIVEAVGQLPLRRHLDEARALFAAHPVAGARQAIAQTLERLAQEVALWERVAPEVERWVDARARG